MSVAHGTKLMKELSVVIPAYNEEAMIGSCLGHVIAACVEAGISYEVIVVDNASTDATTEIAARVARVVYEPRKGITFARQAGLMVSTGKLVANIDADTQMPWNWVKRVIAEFENCNVVAVSGPPMYFDAPLHVQILAFIFNIGTFVVYLLGGATLQGGNFTVRRDVLLATGGFNTTIDFYGEDTDIAWRVSQFGKIRWSWRLRMFSSSRRLMSEGVMVTGIRYAINYFYIILFGKPYTDTHRDIRL